jgi:hypothetical protein
MRHQCTVLAALMALLQGMDACTVPVFRYALDHWVPDSFAFEVSPASANAEHVAHFARNLGSASGLNVEVSRLPDDTLGAARLMRPAMGGNPPTVIWSGAPDPQAIAALMDSPARQELVKRLLAGDSSVFVVVESADKQSNDAALGVLEKRIRYLEQVIRLPLIDPNDPSSKLGPGPALALKYSVLRINPSLSTEAPLLAMLAGPHSALEKTKEPWIAVVFGRGRVLGAWRAADFQDDEIEEVCLFLAGACSCQVKRQNPGWDLLLKCDWEERLQAMGLPPDPNVSPADAAAAAQESAARPETVRFRGNASAAEPSRANAPPEDVPFPPFGIPIIFLCLVGAGWRTFKAS